MHKGQLGSVEEKVGDYKLEKGKHRLFFPFFDLCIFHNALYVASSLYSQIEIKEVVGDSAALECNQFPLEVWLPIVGPVRSALNDRVPRVLQCCILPKATDIDDRNCSVPTSGFARATMAMASASFVNMYENNKSCIVKKFGTNVENWSDICNFARVLRNCCSHGGELSFQTPNSSPVHWHHITYEPSQNERLVIGGDFSQGDLLVFMLEFSNELDALGSPE